MTPELKTEYAIIIPNERKENGAQIGPNRQASKRCRTLPSRLVASHRTERGRRWGLLLPTTGARPAPPLAILSAALLLTDPALAAPHAAATTGVGAAAAAGADGRKLRTSADIGGAAAMAGPCGGGNTTPPAVYQRARREDQIRSLEDWMELWIGQRSEQMTVCGGWKGINRFARGLG